MADTKTALEPATREQTATVSAPRWIPRVVRCQSCQALARETARERVSDEEIVIRFECDYCCHQQTRHYFEHQLS